MAAQNVPDAWQLGDSYEHYVGRWSRRVAPLFLSWLAVPGGRKWLDIGCGTGALSAAIVAQCSPASVTGVEPSEGFLATARNQLGAEVALLRGSATGIPLDTSSVDAVVSGLVLNFVPDPRAALAEMARVSADGGTIAAYVWDYADEMQLMRYFWAAAVALDPGAAALDEGGRFPICHPDRLSDLFAESELTSVETIACDVPTSFTSFDDYWQPFLGGQGPAPAYVMSLDEAARTRLRDSLRARLPLRDDGSIELTARAWAVRAAVRK